MDIKELEKLRKKAIKFYVIGTTICFLITVLVVFFTKNLNCAILSFLVGISLTIFLNKSYEKFNSSFEEMFVVRALKDVFTDLEYVSGKGIDETVIENTNMIQLGDRYSSKNYIKGKYKDVYLEQADVHIEQSYQTKDDVHFVTLFKGRWIIFDFNKYFRANMLVRQRNFRNSKGCSIFSNLHKVVTEDESFNNEFKVYAQDDHEAFYILTPSLIEKIQNVANGIDGSLIFCFVDNKLHIGINNSQDSFKHSIFRKVDIEKIKESISSDIKLITDFVDKLSLDNTLFKRRLEQ